MQNLAAIRQKVNFYTKANGQYAFTLVEILCAVSILLILIILITSSLKRNIQVAQSAMCTVNLGKIYQASMLYSQDNDNRVVPSYPPPPTLQWWPKAIEPYVSDVSVFACPSMKISELDMHSKGLMNIKGKPLYLGYSKNITMSYGYNWSSLQGDAGSKITKFTALHRQVFIVDGWFINTGDWINDPPNGHGSFRHNNKTNVLFLDGHVEALSAPIGITSDKNLIWYEPN